MRRTRIAVSCIAMLLALFTTGCGAISAGTIVQKGGMWLAQEGAKKAYKKFKEDKKDKEQRSKHDEMSHDRNGSSDSYPRRERHHED